MAILRVAFMQRFFREKIDGVLMSSVHDSIVVDVKSYEVERVNKMFQEVFKEGPRLFQEWFGMEFFLPLRCEVSVGPNMHDLVEI